MKIEELFFELDNSDENEKGLAELEKILRNKKDSFEKKTLKYMFENNVFLYRGMNSKDLVFIKSPRSNRQPRDLVIDIHNLINEIMDELKIKATRANSFFVINNFDEARTYGNVYLAFPLKGFSFYTNYSIYDLYEDFSHIFVDFIKRKMRDDKKIHDLFVNNFLNDEAFEYFFDKLYSPSISTKITRLYNSYAKNLGSKYSFHELISKILNLSNKFDLIDKIKLFFKDIVLDTVKNKKEINNILQRENIDINTFNEFTDKLLEMLIVEIIFYMIFYVKSNKSNFSEIIKHVKNEQEKNIYIFILNMIKSNDFKNELKLIIKNYSIYENRVNSFSPEFIEAIKKRNEILINGEVLFINNHFFENNKAKVINLFLKFL